MSSQGVEKVDYSCSDEDIFKSNQIKLNLFAISKVHSITVHKNLHFTWLDRQATASHLRLPKMTKLKRTIKTIVIFQVLVDKSTWRAQTSAKAIRMPYKDRSVVN